MRKLLLFALFISQAQTAEKFALTVDNIMRGPGLVGYPPEQVRWSGDGKQIYFQWKLASQKEEEPADNYVANRDGSGLHKLTDDEAKLAPPVFTDTSRDGHFSVYSRSGDIILYDNATAQVRELTKTSDAELNPHFLPDGKRIAFTRGGNLYVMGIDSPVLIQMTDIRSAAAPGAAVAPAVGTGGGRGRGGRGAEAPPTATGEPQRGTDSQEYLKKEQKDLLEAVRTRAALREEAEAKRKKENPRKPFTLQARQSVNGLHLTSDEKYVFALVTDTGNAKNTVVPNFITESAYTEDIAGRSNVGDTQARSRLAVIDVATGDVRYVDPGLKTEDAKPREIRFGQPVWSADGARAVLFASAADSKDRWLLALDIEAAKTRVLANDHNHAWVSGPQGTTTILGWMKNDREVYFLSERTGYSHLNTVAFEGGGEPRALTAGKWEVTDVQQSRDKSHFYITASKESLYDQNLYEVAGDGGTLTRITSQPGKHDAVVSPDGGAVADVYSYTNKPPDLFVQENRPQAAAKRITTSPTAEFSQFAWLDVPIVSFPARDGVQVPARLFKPANFRRGGPGVIFIHGAGYLQNVDHKWSTYYHEYMFNHILMEHGYMVIDVDYRGSAGYGSEWRTAVYEHMGGKDLDDIVDAAKYLVAAHGVDPKKIGIYGGSYGGFLTLMALFTQPDVFAAGAALRPVTDWAMYNHGYTSNILNLPQTSSEAYRKSSPIYFAQGLKGALLICHGMVDTNVEFQDSVRLAQRLIELRKENWELAVYPVENHGFIQPSSWADEYKRILKLFERSLKG